MKYVRLYADNLGESHFENLEEELSLVEFAPPAPPIFVSDAKEAKRFLFLRIPQGWSSDWHPVPKCQYFFLLSGTVEIKASDGEVRTFSPGSVILGEDTSGKGHKTRVIGMDDAQVTIFQLD